MPDSQTEQNMQTEHAGAFNYFQSPAAKKLLDPKNEKKIDRQTLIQPSGDLDVLYRMAEEGRDGFRQAVCALAGRFGGTVLSRQTLKGRDRVLEKLKEDGAVNASNIYDLDGHTIVMDNLDGVSKVYEYILGDSRTLRTKNRFAHPGPTGYRDILVNTRLPNGMISEIQITTKAMLEAKKIGHVFYEIEIRPLTGYEELFKTVLEAESAVYENAWEQSYLPIAEASRSASSLEIVVPFIRRSARDTGDSFSVLSEKTQKAFHELSSKANGISSLSKNSRPSESVVIDHASAQNDNTNDNIGQQPYIENSLKDKQDIVAEAKADGFPESRYQFPPDRIEQQIHTAFPSFSQEECDTSILLLQCRSKTLGMSFSQYLQRFHPDGFAFRDDSLNSSYKGYVQFLEDDVRSVIRAGKQADFSTFVHETAHVFRRQLTGKLRLKAEQAFGVQNGSWTVNREELFARGFEEYIRTKYADGADKRAVFEKGSQFMQRIYSGLDRIIGITPEMKAVYDELLTDSRYPWSREKFEKQISEIASGKGMYRESHICMGMTPALYEEFGFERLPVMITAKHLHAIINESGLYKDAHYHGLGKELVTRIPEQLKMPVFVMQSATNPAETVVVTDLSDNQGRPVIVPFSPNKRGTYNGIRIDINLAKSIYGRNGFEHFIETAVKENRILYADKKKSRTYLSPGLQLPGSQDFAGLFTHNISRYLDSVNTLKNHNNAILHQSVFHGSSYHSDFSSYPHYLNHLLKTCIESGTAPWMRSWQAGELIPPYNPVTGQVYEALPLTTHRLLTGSQDSRYLRPQEILNTGLKLEKKAVPAVTAYRQTVDNKPVTRYEILFNGNDITGLPPEQKISLPHRENRLSVSVPDITGDRQENLKNTMAVFIACSQSCLAYPPEGAQIPDKTMFSVREDSPMLLHGAGVQAQQMLHSHSPQNPRSREQEYER